MGSDGLRWCHGCQRNVRLTLGDGGGLRCPNCRTVFVGTVDPLDVNTSGTTPERDIDLGFKDGVIHVNIDG